MKRIIVFGSEGFFGKSICETLTKDSAYEVIAATRKDCDLLHAREVSKYLQKVKPDYVIHAAYIEVNSNVKPTKIYLAKNKALSRNVLKACRHLPIKRIICFGSGLEYGDSEEPIAESHALNPKNYYAYTKSICSTEAITIAQRYELPLVLIKAFNVYGQNDRKSVIYYLLSSMLGNKPIFTTKGEQIRDFIHIDDLTSLVTNILTSDAHQQAITVNAGSGRGISLQEIVTLMQTITQYTGEITVKPYRENEYFSQIASIELAESIFNWKPIVKIDQGIKRTIAWIKNDTERKQEIR